MDRGQIPRLVRHRQQGQLCHQVYASLRLPHLYVPGTNTFAAELDKTKVTGVEPVNKLQDGVNSTVGGQLGKGGLLQPVGDAASKEGINRAERGGKDDKGSYGGPMGGVTDPVANQASSAGSSLYSGASGVAGKASSGAKGAGNYVGSFFGGGGKKEETKGGK